MKQSEAIQLLNTQDAQKRYIYTSRDLAKVLPDPSERASRATRRRLAGAGILLKASKNIYVYALSKHLGDFTLERLATTLRRGEYNYISLESALSAYGAISQIPLDRLTVMTTGRKGEYKTPFGTIEFTHTKRAIRHLIPGLLVTNNPLRLATKQAAWRDLKRVGRNTHLVDETAIYED
jgi:predicted transcriptional regulator of viral defense system